MREKARQKERLKFGCLLLLLTLRCLLGCPIYRWFGVNCPGCGLTRAWLHFLAGNWQEAQNQHPLFLVAPIFILMFAQRDTFSEKMHIYIDFVLCLFGILAFAFGIYRA